MSRLLQAWELALDLAFAVLCVLFQAAALRAHPATVLPVAILLAGCFGTACWRPRAALFALLAAMGVLTGWGQISFFNFGDVLGLAFSAVFLGTLVRRGLKREFAGPAVAPWVRLGTDLLTTAVLLSLASQLRQLAPAGAAGPGSLLRLFYARDHYFISCAFIWLEGLFAFRLLCLDREDRVLKWAPGILAMTLAVQATFAAIQYCWDFPVRYDTMAYACYAPFEDIHSYGSFAVVAFAFFLARFSRQRRAAAAGATLALVLVAGSWSRATWLAAILTVLLVAALRLPKKMLALAGLVTLAALLFVNLNAHRPSWQSNLYVQRLITLVKFERLSNKDPSRVRLYQKALKAIESRPWTGYGIGTFHAISPQFAVAGDPDGPKPEYAHDFILQLAAEMGAPLALLFCGLAAAAVRQGFRPGAWGERPEQAVALALIAYLSTQLTANAVNMYLTNQFLFWFLLAALLHLASDPRRTAPAAA